MRADRARLRLRDACRERRRRPGDRADRARRHDTGDARLRASTPIVHRATTADRRSCYPATRARCSTRPRSSPSSPRGSATTSSRATGRRLLGADDKAGVAEIMAAVAWLAAHPESSRAPVRVAFTVDEEVGSRHRPLRPRRVRRRRSPTRSTARVSASSRSRRSRRRQLHVTIRGRGAHPGTREGQARERRQARRRSRRRAAARHALAGDDRGARGLRAPDAHPRDGRGDGRQLHRPRPRRGEARASTSRSCSGSQTTIVRREPRARVSCRRRDPVPRTCAMRSTSTRASSRPRVEAIRRVGVEAVLEPIRGGTDGSRLSETRSADPEPLHRRPGLPLPARVGERAGHGRRRGDDRRARRDLGETRRAERLR